ncbi:MAG: large extracellular alpha-helical protein [bacterium]|nr:large extracellular alpha-helical protein [bacterium]
MRRYGPFTILCIAVLAFLPGLIFSSPANSAAKPAPLQIVRITPTGKDVPAGRQIVFQFDRAVVPVGRMERNASEVLITISPAADCRWRWLNTSALACQLDETSSLKPATRYRILVNPGIKSEDDATLAKPVQHHFITERPAVRHSWFRTWKAPGVPLIRMTFNQPVSRMSVAEHVFMRVGGQKRRRIKLNVEPDPRDKQAPLFLPVPGEKLALIPSDAGTSQPAGAGPTAGDSIRKTGFRRVWLVAPVVELPLDRPIELKVEPGLISFDGPQPGAENRVLVAFHTFPEFAFDSVECTDNTNKKITIRAAEAGRDVRGRCNPLKRVALVFSAPVIEDEVKNHVKIIPDLAGERTDYDPWANNHGYSRLRSPHKQGRRYRVWLPEVLRADQTYHLQSDPADFRDEFGRTLPAPIDMRFATDHRPPDFILTHPRAVLEKTVDTEMPLVVTNLKQVTLAYDRLTAKGKQSGLKHELQISPAEDIAYRTPLQVREMLSGQSGVVQGRVETSPPVSKHFGGRWFFAQVTPFQVHVKIGHYNTLVWVTDFKTGLPVAGAAVKIFSDTYTALPQEPSVLTRAMTDAGGMALLAGTRTVDPALKGLHSYKIGEPRLFVQVDKDSDMALVPLDRHFRVDTYRASRYTVSPAMRRRYGHIHTWGTTAQGIYRAGDTVQYKLYVRNQSNATFVPAIPEGYTLEIIDPTGKIVHTVDDIALSEFGAHDGEFAVAKTGAVGWYRFQLKADFTEAGWEPMRVLVSDFTPAPFKVATDLNGQQFQPGDSIEVSTRARLHSGGPYTDAGSRVTATLESRQFRTDDPAARGFRFSTYVPGAPARQTVHQIESSVDDRGDQTTRFDMPQSKILYGQLVVESAVRDDRGKYITGRATADYAGRDRYVGLRSAVWTMNEDEPAEVDLMVVDVGGKPRAGVPIQVKVERRETKAARVKGAGNAYLTHYTHHWAAIAQCEIRSELEPVQCGFTPQDPGSHRITATIQDSRNRSHSSEIYQWVVGKGRVVWQERPDNSLEIIAEKARYRVGDTARYLVKNPFPGARALITVERYGVLQSWLETLESGTPIIEFEVRKDFMPEFYLSVVVVSPRVAMPPSDSRVDLGKPAFRMGYVKVPVADPYKEIRVTVKTERNTYRPRERVRVNLTATPNHPVAGEPIEMAVAVLDEAVFDLLVQGRNYFDPYQGFYTVDGLDLVNYSLLMRLVGRQKFEKKGASTGGGGGLDISLRSVFKFVSYWNPSMIADAAGRATFEFEVPDNLTGWRILAMAVTPGDRMGLGDGSFKVNRPTELRPVMPNQVTAGDSFEAGFSIMNRTAQKRKLTVTLSAAGNIEPDAGQKTRSTTRTVEVEPYKRATVWLPVATTTDGSIKFTAGGGDELDRDGLVHTVDVHKRVRLETAANYGSTVAQTVSERILFPSGIRTDVGRVSLQMSPTVIGNLTGAFRYMRDYSYICWEQVLTRGVMASHYNNLTSYMPEDFNWQGSQRLPQSMLEQATAYQAPNGGMAYYIPQDRYVSPYLSAYTALAFNWLRKSGLEIPAAVEQKLHEYLFKLLRRNVVPDFYTRGMASTVRAVALAALAEQGKVKYSDLQRYRPHVPRMSLFGKAHFLLAALGVAGTDAMRTEVANLILAHASQSGGKLVFSEVVDDSYSRILASALRTNGAILSALTAYGGTDAGRQLVDDIPFKIVRYITQSRKNRDHWENTQENMFCMNALIDFSRVYESQAPDMTLRALFDAEVMGQAEFTDLRDDPVEFHRPVAAADPGREAMFKISRQGQGRLYYGVSLSYAPQLLKAESINAGIEIHREYSLERNGSWELLTGKMQLKRGDLVRVDLFVSLPTARNFVVVDDPVPGGLEPVNRDLATASTVDADKGDFKAAGGSWWFRNSGWSSYGVSRWSFYHRELRHNAARFYSEYLPAGNYHLSYTAQVIAPGEFAVMPARAAEMYDPDIYGQGVPGRLEVQR